MRLWNFTGFEMPRVFTFGAGGKQPAQPATMETRRVSDAFHHPNVQFFDPASLHFPDHNFPTVPGNGGYITCGLGMVEYDHQATWDRGATDQAGPVRKFFRDQMYDNRIKHL